jgi:hypothetical protein
MHDPDQAAAERLETLKQIPPLMPQFLSKRRLGLPAAREAIARLGIEPPAFFALVRFYTIQGSYGGAVSVPQARLWSSYIYSARDTLSSLVAAWQSRGLVEEVAEGRYRLTPEAERMVRDLHEAARAFVSRSQPLPSEELRALTEELERAATAVIGDPHLSPRAGSHLAGSRSLAVFGPDAPLMVRVEQAIYDLWLARDDAHTGAWRDAGMEGPPMQILTLLWAGAASSISTVLEQLGPGVSPDELEWSLVYLLERDLITRDGDALSLTPSGALLREDIERDTDLTYFASWPHSLEEARWLRLKLRELIDNLPPPP